VFGSYAKGGRASARFSFFDKETMYGERVLFDGVTK
jgi:hypothetical protein